MPKKLARDRLPACRRNRGQLVSVDCRRVDRVALGHTGCNAQRQLVDYVGRQVLDWSLGWVAMEQLGDKGEVAGQQGLVSRRRVVKRRVLVLLQKACLVRMAAIKVIRVEPD